MFQTNPAAVPFGSNDVMYNYDVSLKSQVYSSNLKALPFKREKIDYAKVFRNRDINTKSLKWPKDGSIIKLKGRDLRRQLNREDSGIIL
jgi:hypothetical protein